MKKFIFFARVYALLLLGIPKVLFAQDSLQSYPNYVVIGAFAYEENAIQFTAEANTDKFPAKFEINPNRNLFYVYVLSTGDRAFAFDQARKLRTDTKYFDTWVYNGVLGASSPIVSGNGSSQDLNPETGGQLNAVRVDEQSVGPNNNTAALSQVNETPLAGLSANGNNPTVQQSGVIEDKTKAEGGRKNRRKNSSPGDRETDQSIASAAQNQPKGESTTGLNGENNNQIANNQASSPVLTTSGVGGDQTLVSAETPAVPQLQTSSGDKAKASRRNTRKAAKQNSQQNSGETAGQVADPVAGKTNGLPSGQTSEQKLAQTPGQDPALAANETTEAVTAGQTSAQTTDKSESGGDKQATGQADKQTTAAQTQGQTSGRETSLASNETTGLIPGQTSGQRADKSKAATNQQSTGQASKQTTAGQTQGQTTSQPSQGQTSGQDASLASNETTGVTSGQTSGQTADKSKAGANQQSTGQASKQTTAGQKQGQTTSQPSQTQGQTSAQDASLASNETTGVTPGQTSGQTTDKSKADANKQSTGQAGKQTSAAQKQGESAAQPSQTQGQTSAQDASLASNETTGVTPGQASGQTADKSKAGANKQNTDQTGKQTTAAQKQGQTTGPPSQQTQGQTSAQDASLASNETTGVTPGQTSGQTADKSKGGANKQSTGQAGKQTTAAQKQGQSAAQPSQQTQGQTSGQDASLASNKTTGVTPGQTTGQTTDQTKTEKQTTGATVGKDASSTETKGMPEEKKTDAEIAARSITEKTAAEQRAKIASLGPPPRPATTEPLKPEEVVGKNFYFHVFRADNHDMIDGEVDAIDFEKSRKMATYQGNSSVKVMMPAGKTKQISFVCEVFGYRKLQLEFDPAAPAEDLYLDDKGNLVVPFELARLQKGDIAIMYNVFFFKDAAVMRPESRYEVNNLLELLVENPSYKIRIHGHTNGNASGKIIRMNKAGNYYSLSETKQGFGSAKELSEERAVVMRDFLVNSGVPAERMEVKAWGGKKPIHDKNSVRANENVRVEIEILSQ